MDELPKLTPEDMDGPPLLGRHDRQRVTANNKADRINNDTSMSEPAKIDAVAAVRGWFSSDTSVVDAYMADTLSASQAAAKLATPIDEAYSTANHGAALWEAERSARTQRKYHAPEKALEMWGPEEDFPAPDDATKALPNAEMSLWELWYAVLHVSRRIPWDDDARQEKLADLVRTLKARPDPPLPERVTTALRRNWIWKTGTLWSELIMLGPSVAESWNDCCGCGAGWTAVEQRAWVNVNAFLARLTGSGTAEFPMQGVGALYEATEDKLKARSQYSNAPVSVRLSVYMRVASVWAIFAGGRIYEEISREDDDGVVDGEDVPLEPRWRKFPWKRGDDITEARWTFWHRMVRHLSEKEELQQEARDMAARAARLMVSIQQGRAAE